MRNNEKCSAVNWTANIDMRTSSSSLLYTVQLINVFSVVVMLFAAVEASNGGGQAAAAAACYFGFGGFLLLSFKLWMGGRAVRHSRRMMGGRTVVDQRLLRVCCEHSMSWQAAASFEIFIEKGKKEKEKKDEKSLLWPRPRPRQRHLSVAARPPAIGSARGSLKSGHGGDRTPPALPRQDATQSVQVCNVALSFFCCAVLWVSLFVLIRLRHFTWPK